MPVPPSVRATWPLVGRDEELALMRTMRRDTRASGVVLAGVAGTGKSRLAAEAMAEAAAEGCDTVRIVATRAVATIPFGAFASFLPPVEDATDRLVRTAEAFATRAAERQVALLVDDVDLLDDASAALLQRIMGDGSVFAITTVRTGGALPDSVVALWKDLQAARLDVQPLSRDETGQLLESVLDGPLDGASAHQLWSGSQGNPLYLHELVLSATTSGTLVLDRGVWTLHAQLGAPPSLRDVVELRLARLSDAAVAALDDLAVAGAVGLALLEAAHGRPALEELEQRGLVEVGEDRRRRPVRLAHPLYGDVLRNRMTAIGAARVNAALAQAIEQRGARRREDVLQVASWRLEGGGAIDPPMLVGAAREAYRSGDYRLTERLLRTAPPETSSPEASLLLAQLLHEHGRHAESESTYAALDATSLGEAERGRLALQRAVNLFFGLGEDSRAIEVLDGTRAGIDSAEVAGELTANEAWLELNAGRADRALDLVATLDEATDADVRLMATVTSAWAHALGGRPELALLAADRAAALRDPTAPPRLNRFRDYHALPRAIALLEDGQLDAAEASIRAGHARSLEGQPTFIQAWWVFLRGRLQLAKGRVRSAAGSFRQGAVLQTRMHQPGLLSWNLGGLGLANTLAGDGEGVAAVLRELDVLGDRPERMHAVLKGQARAWAALAEGDRDGALAILRAAADQAVAGGLGTMEGAALHDMVRLGAVAGVVDRLARLAERGGALAECRAAHAAAIASRDADALQAVAERFAALGLDLVAAEAFAEAGVLHAAAGRQRRAQRCRTESAALARLCEGARTPSLAAGAEVVPLTVREREVASLAAGGLSSKAIAARLVVSRRTVDNHLQRAYAKLGVRSRSELAEILQVDDLSGTA